MPENVMLTDASVNEIPESRMLRSDELQTNLEESLGKIVIFEHRVVRGITPRKDPKLAPATLMESRPCEVTTAGDGVS